MTQYDETLRQLQLQCAEKRKLEAHLRELRTQRSRLADSVKELEALRFDEQADVDRLEGRNLAAFFFQLTGSIDERLNRERQEAYAAAMKHETAAKELAAAEDDLRRCEKALIPLRDCERLYEAALREKEDAVKAAGSADAAELLRLEERHSFFENQKRELREAVSAGRSALSSADRVLSSLESAEGWGTWDILGGGLISDLAKHSHLDEAQAEVEQLQRQLRRFKTELADVTVQADLQVSIDGFLRFADYFFDGLFADWAVLDRIGRAKGQVYDTRYQIEQVLSRLDSMLLRAEQEQESLKRAREELIRRAGSTL